MTAQQVSRYIELVNRRTQILNHSGVDWKPEYGLRDKDPTVVWDPGYKAR